MPNPKPIENESADKSLPTLGRFYPALTTGQLAEWMKEVREHLKPFTHFEPSTNSPHQPPAEPTAGSRQP
jgi:hypothetical protein